MAIYDDRDRARRLSNPTFSRTNQKQFMGKDKRLGKPVSKPTMASLSGQQLNAMSGDPRESVPATYGNPPSPPDAVSSAQRTQGGVGGAGGTATGDPSGTGVGSRLGSEVVDAFKPVTATGQAIGSGVNSLVQSGAFQATEVDVPGAVGAAIDYAAGVPKRLGSALYDLAPGYGDRVVADRAAPAPTASPAAPVATQAGVEDTYNADYDGASLTPQVADTQNAAPPRPDLGTPVGDSGFYKRTNAAGETRYADAEGNFITNSDLTNRYGAGRGGVSVVGGPGGDKSDLNLDTPEGLQEAINRNVAGYERGIAAIRGLREAQNPGITQPGRASLGNTQDVFGDQYGIEGPRQTEDLESIVKRLGPRKGAVYADLKAAQLRDEQDRRQIGVSQQRNAQDLAEAEANQQFKREELAAGSRSAAAETQRKIGESQADFAVRQRGQDLQYRAKELETQLGINRLSETQQKNFYDSINKIVASGSLDPVKGWNEAFVTHGKDIANALFPDQAK